MTSCEGFFHLRQQLQLCVADEGQGGAWVVCPRCPTSKKKKKNIHMGVRDDWRRFSWNVTLAKPNWPPDSVDVRLYGCGEVKIDDVADILEVHPSGDAVLFVFGPAMSSAWKHPFCARGQQKGQAFEGYNRTNLRTKLREIHASITLKKCWLQKDNIYLLILPPTLWNNDKVPPVATVFKLMHKTMSHPVKTSPRRLTLQLSLWSSSSSSLWQRVPERQQWGRPNSARRWQWCSRRSPGWTGWWCGT